VENAEGEGFKPLTKGKKRGHGWPRKG
jgi:hypothetical protein